MMANRRGRTSPLLTRNSTQEEKIWINGDTIPNIIQPNYDIYGKER